MATNLANQNLTYMRPIQGEYRLKTRSFLDKTEQGLGRQMIVRMLVRFALLVSKGDEKRCQVILYWISLGQMTLVKQVIMCTNDQKGI